MTKHREHKVKSWITFFGPMTEDKKVHDLRFNDRDYHVGDILDLQEYNQNTEEYTGRSMKMEITYMTSADNPCAMSPAGLHKGFVILSVRKI